MPGGNNNISVPQFADLGLYISLISIESTSKLFGKITFNWETELSFAENVFYVRLTIGNNTERILIEDSPPNANTIIKVNFPTLGITLSAKSTYSQTVAWGVLGVLTKEQRASQIAQAFGNAANDVFLRQANTVKVIIPFSTPVLGIVGTIGWVSWMLPQSITTSEYNSLNNIWKAYTGAWINITSKLLNYNLAISDELDNQRAVPEFQERWGQWINIPSVYREKVYFSGYTKNEFLRSLAFPNISVKDAKSAIVYINGVRLSDPIIIATKDGNPYVQINKGHLNTGYSIRVVIPPYSPTIEQFKQTLTGVSKLVMNLTEYSMDYPYSKVDTRNDSGRSNT